MKKKIKHTLTPKLRFPEFREGAEWKAKPLGEMCDRIVEKVGDTPLTPVSISAGKGFVSQVEKFGRDISGAQYKNYIWLRKGDFAYNKGNSKAYPQGCVRRLKEFDQAAAPSAFVSFRLHDGYVPEFFEGLFEKNAHGLQLIKFITSSARSDGLLNISPDEFFSVNLPIPQENAEQQKIAECLSSLDGLIAAEGRMLEALKDHKKGLMQQLFPQPGKSQPRLRFPKFRDTGKWKTLPLGRVIEVASGQVDPTESPYCDLPHVGGENIESHTGTIRDVKTAKELGLVSGKYAFDENDVLYSKIRPALNKVAVPDFKGICSADIYPIRPSNRELRREYLVYLLLSEGFLEHAIKQSDRSKIPKVNRDTLLSYTISLPPFAEQHCIADCLTALDDQITAQAAKIESLRQHKRGLMQQLFPAPEVS
jgi:type I restriction enzyme S subunit